MKILLDGFHRVLDGQLSMEQARDKLRARLTDQNVQAFPMGHHGAAVGDVLHAILSRTPCGTYTEMCPACGHVEPEGRSVPTEFFNITSEHHPNSVQSHHMTLAAKLAN